MFSGGDSSGEGMNFNQFGQYRFTQPTHSQSSHPISAVPNATAASIDWASLAQQWIQMRDNNSTELEGMALMPETVPPPNIAGMHFFAAGAGAPVFSMSNAPKIDATAKAKFECEKGEADMDMDDDEDNNLKAAHMQMCPPLTTTTATTAAVKASTPPPPAPSMKLKLNDLPDNVTQCRTDWYGGGGAVAGGALPQQTANIKPPMGNLPAALISAPQPTQWNMWPPPRQALPLPAAPSPNPTAHIPSLLKMNVPNPNTNKNAVPNTDNANNSTLTTIDAAKRKILPAWIREGLEKMEREKQKQMDQLKSPTGDVSNSLEGQPVLPEKVTPEVMVKNANLSAIVESENSGNEDDDNAELHRRNTPTVRDELAKAQLKSRLPETSPEAPIDTDGDAETEDTQLPSDLGKSYEQKLADLMIVVRRTLTELLLEVTNDEIAQIANETVKLRKTKGLAAYADSSSGDDNTDNEEATDNDGNIDSEEELKAAIRQKRRAFIKISEEIDEFVSAATAREEHTLKCHTEMEHERQQQQQQQQQQRGDKECRGRDGVAGGGVGHGGGKLSERDFGETTETRLQHNNGKRGQRFERSSRKERTTRFSDNKDGKSMAAATASAYISTQMLTQTAAPPSNAATAPPLGAAAATKLFAGATKGASNGKTDLVPMATGHQAALSSSNVGSRGLKVKGNDDRTSTTSRKDSRDGHKRRRRRRGSSSRSSRSDNEHKRKRKPSDNSTSTSSSSSSCSSVSSTSSSSPRRSRRRSASSSSSSSSSSSASQPSSKYSRTSSRKRRQSDKNRRRHERDEKQDEGRQRSTSYRSKSSRSVSKNHEYDKRGTSYDKYQAKNAHHQRHKTSSTSSGKQQPASSSTHTSSKRRDRSRTRSRSKTRSSYKSSYKRR